MTAQMVGSDLEVLESSKTCLGVPVRTSIDGTGEASVLIAGGTILPEERPDGRSQCLETFFLFPGLRR